MADTVTRLASTLIDRYRLERELGQGGTAAGSSEMIMVEDWHALLRR